MELRRVLGFRGLVFFFTLTCFSLRNVATAAEAGPSSLAIWVLAATALLVASGVWAFLHGGSATPFTPFSASR